MAEPEIHTVDESFSGTRLRDFLEAVYPDGDRRFLRRLVESGAARVNYDDADGRKRLGPGDIVEIRLPDGVDGVPRFRAAGAPSTKVEPMPVELFRNEHVVVVEKPPGLPSLPDRAGKSIGALGAAKIVCDDEDLRSVHRLDRDTSGCLCFARTLEMARHLDRAFREQEVAKTYTALVEGVERREGYKVDKWLGPDPRRPGKVRAVEADSKGARSALTEVSVVERFKRHTLLEVHPKTGRGHQIRVHLRSQGHPIVADVDYGASGPLLLSQVKSNYKIRPGQRETPLLERLFLHASRLELPMPDGERVVVESELPKDLSTALQKLRKFATPKPQRQSPDENDAW